MTRQLDAPTAKRRRLPMTAAKPDYVFEGAEGSCLIEDRGVEHRGSHWTYLDLTPCGRQEPW